MIVANTTTKVQGVLAIVVLLSRVHGRSRPAPRASGKSGNQREANYGPRACGRTALSAVLGFARPPVLVDDDVCQLLHRGLRGGLVERYHAVHDHRYAIAGLEHV